MIDRKYTYQIAALIMLLLLTSGCFRGFYGFKNHVENMQVPRLMIESRGMDYAGSGAVELTLPISGSVIQVESTPIVNEFDIINAEMVKVDMGLALMLELTDTGRRELYRRSVTNKGNRVVLTSNDKAIGARVLDGAINDGKFYTFVEMNDDELGEFILDLKASIAELQTRYKY
ncbi:MAG: hypothetical protein ACJAYS_000912 [Lentimonas sp.]|jgi:hypothetical protein